MRRIIPETANAQRVCSQIMLATITEEGRRPPLPLEMLSVQAIAEQIFDYEFLANSADPVLPDTLEVLAASPGQRELLVGLLMCLALVSGEARTEVVTVIDRVAAQLQVSLPQRDLLRFALRRQPRRFLWRITCNAAIDYWAKGGHPSLRDWAQIARQAFIPQLLTSRQIAKRYQDLERFPRESLGRAVYDFYRSHEWALPGEPKGMPEQFIVHECTHVLTGYGTDPHSEMLTAVFTAGAKRRNAIDWFLLPLMQWHLKEPVASLSRRDAYRGLLQPQKYFHAMRRGMDSRISLMDDHWSFWENAHHSVAALCERYNICPADPALVS